MNIMLSVFFIILSVALTKLFCVLANNTRLMDKPNDRSLHTVPTIRGGGCVFIGLSLCSLPVLCYITQSPLSSQFILMFCIMLLAVISFLDDLYTVSTQARLLIQCIVSLLISLYIRPDTLNFVLFSLSNQYVIMVFLFFAVIWAINHFNFMDGLDGFCALQALFLFLAYALLFHVHQGLLYQEFCLILSCTLFGFLMFNFPPAKLFMGDVGSATLGLVSFCIALVAQQKYHIPIVYWFMLNALFLFDATITLIRRMVNREKWFAAHRKHAYQRLKQYGIETRTILLGQALINGIFLGLILLVHYYQFQLIILLLFQLGLISSIYYLVERCFPMFLKPNI